MANAANTQVASMTDHSVISRLGERFGVDATKMVATLKATCFRAGDQEVSNEQLMALCVVADQYKLNPFTKEIYAYPDSKNGGIVPVVGVDGWMRIINEHPQFDGMKIIPSETIEQLDEHHKPCPEYLELHLMRKDRAHPIIVTEYLDECYRPPIEKNGANGPYTIKGPWQTHTKRMLRHKVIIQGGRVAFGFAGIYDPDEAERVVEAEVLSSSYKSNTRKPQTREPQQIQEQQSAGGVTIDQEPEPPKVETISIKEATELANFCVAGQVEMEAVVDHFGIEAIEKLPISKLAEAQGFIEDRSVPFTE